MVSFNKKQNYLIWMILMHFRSTATCCKSGRSPQPTPFVKRLRGAPEQHFTSLVASKYCSYAVTSLKARWSGVRFPPEAKFFFSPKFQIDSGAHQAFYTADTGGFFPRDNAVPENDVDLSPSPSAKVKNEWSHASNGHICFMACIEPKTFMFIRYINK
jgi:hypothetical protein